MFTTTTMKNYLNEFFPEFATFSGPVILGVEVFTVQHIMCYMLHRIASTERTGRAGAVKFNVFLSAELFSLCKAARKEFGDVRFPLDMKTIFADVLFKNALT